MMIKISFLILCFQLINLTSCTWEPHAPLILIKKQDKVFFPTYVNALNPDVEFPLIKYVDPEDTTTLTYSFCTNSSSPDKSLGGFLWTGNTDRYCKSVDFTREQKQDRAGNPIPCGGQIGNENTGYYEYRTYFKLQIDDNTYIRNSYNYCYDPENSMSTLYAYYDLKNPNLLENKYLLSQQSYKFSLERPTPENNPHDDVDILKYYDLQNDYKPYEVAVSEFIPFGHWRNSFYQWHNTAPLNVNLHSSWKTLINKVKSKLAQKTEPVKVFSGIFGVKKLKNSIFYLPNSKITVPLVWWIILYNENKSKGVAFIMHNFIFDNPRKKPMPWCSTKTKYCDEAGLDGLVPEDQHSEKTMIYCCPVLSLIAKILQIPNVISPTEDLLKF